MMYLIMMETVQSVMPKDPKERMKIMTPIMEMGKKDLDSGELKMIGMGPDGQNSFVISNQDLKTIYIKTQLMAPYIKSKVMPMLTFDEAMDVMKEMQK